MPDLSGLVARLDLFRPTGAPDDLSETERRIFRTCEVLLFLLLGMGAVSLVAQHYGLGRTPYHFRLSSAGFDMITNSGFLGIALCYARLRPPLGEQVRVALLGLSLEAFLAYQRPASWGLTGSLMGMGLGLGLAGALGLAWHSLAGEPGRRVRARGYLAIALFMMLFPTVTLWAHYVVIQWNPQVYDLFAVQVDRLPGFLPSFAVGTLLGNNWILLSLALLIYNELPLLLILAVFLVMDHPERCYNNVIGSFAGMGLAGFLLYNLYPAVGLGVLYPDAFPQGPEPVFTGVPELLNLPGPRNCMPSLHMSWILCLFFAVFRVDRRVLVCALTAVGFTVLSTLYLGHYWIDLVAAFPLALIFQERTARSTPDNGGARRAALVGGVLLLALSLGSLRWLHAWLVAFPAATLAGEAAIVGTCLALERNLARATLFPAPAPAAEPAAPTVPAAV